jgi:hypothetical protein
LHAKRAKVLNYVKVGDGWRFANLSNRIPAGDRKGHKGHRKVGWKTGV